MLKNSVQTLIYGEMEILRPNEELTRFSMNA